ncbi:MAG: hypothetical protein KJ614_00125 [Gammaproteobacteria bacterium]|nr:hypothetical protein [Gammaproteobacteria bacterium]MBU3998299.1 hypothetical protein [Gammaproteobacteria bacterium]
MPYFKFASTSKQVSLKDVFGNDPDTLMVWLHTHITRNSRAQSQPIVRVAFRKVIASGVSEQIVYRDAPITALGQLRIGSVWKDGFCRSQAAFGDATEFEVNFSESGWRHTSFQQTRDQPYDWACYPLHYQRDKNQFLVFDLKGGGRLVVPCLEFFYRCYGRSAEIKRVLTTYPWHGAKEPHLSKLYAELDDLDDGDQKWRVKLKMRLVLDDVLLLAHAKYEDYTERVLRGIYSQIEADHDTRYSPEVFLKIRPWHQGKATLKVRGIQLNNGSFLALQIIGCSDPEGKAIERDREELQKFDGIDIDGRGGDDPPSGQVRRFRKTPLIVDLTGSEEPDHGVGSTEILDTEFVVVGKRRVVIDVRRNRVKSGARQRGGRGVTSPAVVSGGDPYGSGKGVGQASINAKQVMESNGMLRDMWNAMLYLQRQNPTRIQSVAWFTFESEFCTDSEPEVIGLTPFKDDDESVNTETRNWLYLDVDSKVFRGVLIARLRVDMRNVFIVEIERRTRQMKDVDGATKESEEKLKGLVFTLDDEQAIGKWLTELLCDIQKVRGIVQKISGKIPGNALTFSHKSSGNDEIVCQAMVVNALGKMGISLD